MEKGTIQARITIVDVSHVLLFCSKGNNLKPQRFFGMHFEPGVAEYRESGKAPFRILINEETIKKMDPTFEGMPVYVHHIDDVDLNKDVMKGDKEQRPADGVVVKSFYNKADGKHWAEFIITTEKGLNAVLVNKWKLSNAYIPEIDKSKGGGTWHGVDYQKEIVNGQYEHLAIVPNPRYEESVIMTPEQFKAYNNEKEAELLRIANSKETNKGESKMLKLFKREKVENSVDFETMMVVLPKSGKEMTLTTLVNEMDKVVNMAGYANEEHMVKVGNEEMSVKDLVNKHISMCNEAEEEKKKNADKDKEEEEKKENKEDDKEKEEKKENSKENFDKLKNAPTNPDLVQEVQVVLAQDRLERGKSRYGR